MAGFQFISESFVDGKGVKITIRSPVAGDEGQSYLMSSEEAVRLASTILASVKVRVTVSISDMLPKTYVTENKTTGHFDKQLESKDAKAPHRTRRRR